MSGVEDGSFIHFYDALERWSNSQVLKRKSIFSNASVVELLDGHCFIGHPGVWSNISFKKRRCTLQHKKAFAFYREFLQLWHFSSFGLQPWKRIIQLVNSLKLKKCHYVLKWAKKDLLVVFRLQFFLSMLDDPFYPDIHPFLQQMPPSWIDLIQTIVL